MFTVGNIPGVSDYNIVVKGTGDANTDENNLAAAVNTLNGWGKGTLWIDGQVILLNDKKFTAPINLKGMDSNAEIVVQSTNPAFVAAFSWNESFAYTSLTSYNISTSKQKSEYVSVSGIGYTPTEGDWVLVWDLGATISDLAPHNVGGAQGPMEIHQVCEYDSAAQRAYFSDAIIDLLNVSGKLGVIDFQENVEVRDLKFTQTTSQIDFQNALYFRKINGVTVSNIRMDRNGVGAIYASFCANVDISNVHIEGTLKNDNVYGVVAGIVNNFNFRDSVVYGTRHAFTTTAGASSGLTRFGTPLNCNISNVQVYTPSKIDSSNTKTTRVGLDTHAEGYGINFNNCTVHCMGDTSNIAAQTRSRNSVFKNCRFYGTYSTDTGNGTKGVRISGYKGLVDSCYFSGMWRPLDIIAGTATGKSNSCVIKNCTFDGSTSAAITFTEGSGHIVDSCTFKNCSALFTGSEYGDIIRITNTTGSNINHRITNCVFLKDSAKAAINAKDLTPSQIKVLGNTFIGFSYPTSSGPLGFLESGVYGQNLEKAYAFSNHYDNSSYAGRKAGQDALGNISGVTTIDFSAGTYDNKTAILNGNLTLTASGDFAGEYYLLTSQDSTGSRTITWSNVNWNGADPQPKVTGLTTSLFQLYHTGDGSWYGLSYFNN